MLAGLHFGLDFAAELGQRDPRPMLLGRSLVAARRQATDTRSVELGANTKCVAERPGDRPPTQGRWSWERTRNAWQRGQATSHRHKVGGAGSEHEMRGREARRQATDTRSVELGVNTKLVCQDRPEAVWGSSPESRAPSELVSVQR